MKVLENASSRKGIFPEVRADNSDIWKKRKCRMRCKTLLVSVVIVYKKKSCVQETKHLSTDAASSTDTKKNSAYNLLIQKCYKKNAIFCLSKNAKLT